MTPPRTPFSAYQKRLFLFLSVASFFEGYDNLAVTQVLPNLRADLGLSKAAGGLLISFINVGAVAAFLLMRRADRWGRRRLLMVTITGYTLCTFLSGLAPEALSFGVFQFLARMFLLAEWAVAMVCAAEEFPADRRGLVIGVIQAFSSVGSVLCAAVAPLLLTTPLGWRSVYFVGIVPLLIVAWARRDLRETRRFEEQVIATGAHREQPPLRAILGTPWRGRVLLLGAIWFATFACTQNAITFWKEFALAERGFSDAHVGLAVSVAAVASVPLVFFAGKLLDWLGRKPGAALIFGSTALGVFASYTLEGFWPLSLSLAVGIFGVTAVLPVLNAFSTELFPTALRGDAWAWANNLIGRVSYVSAPALVGLAAETVGWGAAVRSTALFLLVALALILIFLPETANRELEETSALESGA